MRRNFKQEILAEIEEVRKSLDSIERILNDLDDEENSSGNVRKRTVEAVEAAADNSREFDLAKFSHRPVAVLKTGKVNFVSNKKILNKATAPATNANVPPRNTGNFMGEYNALADKNGVELRNARADFLKRYQVRTFSCVNAEARVKTPAPPPEFRDRDNGDFWAIPSALVSGSANENTYVVYPNVAIKQYTPNHHSDRALGEVFDSNFVSGGAYSKIRVEQFAIFTCSGEVWTLIRKGKLSLE